MAEECLMESSIGIFGSIMYKLLDSTAVTENRIAGGRENERNLFFGPISTRQQYIIEY